MSIIKRLRYQFLRSPGADAVSSLKRLFLGSAIRRRKLSALGIEVSATVEELRSEFQAKGYANLDAIVDQSAVRALKSAADSLPDSSSASAPNRADVTEKPFWTRPLDRFTVDGKLPTDSEFVQFALQPSLLSFVGSVLGELPQLDYVLLTRSSHHDSEPMQSQMWHRDYDSPRTIKVFVYLTDVTDVRDGPFTFFPAPQSAEIGSFLRSHVTDAALNRRSNGFEPRQMIAPRLSVFAVETSRCLHMGSRVAPGHSRLLYTATYTSFPKPLSAAQPKFMPNGELGLTERLVLFPNEI